MGIAVSPVLVRPIFIITTECEVVVVVVAIAITIVKRKWGSLRPNHPGKEPAPGRTPKRIGNSINRQQHKRKMYYPNVYIGKDLLPQGGDTSSSSSLPKKAYI
jgi:hypothetical protein